MMKLTRIAITFFLIATFLSLPLIVGADEKSGGDTRSGETEDKRDESKKDQKKDEGGGKDEYDAFVDKDGDRVNDHWEGFKKKEQEKDKEKERDRDRAGEESGSKKKESERRPSPQRSPKPGAVERRGRR